MDILPPTHEDHVTRMRGARPRHLPLSGRQTALVVLDMQNYFLLPDMPAYTPAAVQVIPAVNALARSVREAGGRVIWIRMSAGPEARPWPALDELRDPDHNALRKNLLRPGSLAHALHDEVDRREGDHVVDKDRFSALAPGSSRLEEVLREQGITTVVIAGTATDVCCATTARDALQLGFRVVMASDATASDETSRHADALDDIERYFGDVRSTAELRRTLSVRMRGTQGG